MTICFKSERTICFGDYTYNTPEGRKIFEKNSDSYKVTEIRGDWVKIEQNGRHEGWAKWKSDTEILIDIVERVYM